MPFPSPPPPGMAPDCATMAFISSLLCVDTKGLKTGKRYMLG